MSSSGPSILPHIMHQKRADVDALANDKALSVLSTGLSRLLENRPGSVFRRRAAAIRTRQLALELS